MLTFVSGWRTSDREKALVGLRDLNRDVVFFIDDTSTLPAQFPAAPLIDVWRNGHLDFQLAAMPVQMIRINYDTDNDLIVRVMSRALMQGSSAQFVVTIDAVDALYRFFPALREGGALLAAGVRLDAAEGDHVIFTRGGSFFWTDHVLESQTAMLIGTETYDAGVVTDETAALSLPAADHRW